MGAQMSVSPKDWKWFGNAGHFICGEWCRFHLCTQVGCWLVSTVGEYIPPILSQGSEQKEAVWLKRHPTGQEIGLGRTFETMVFMAGKPCSDEICGCGLPEISGSELDVGCYNSRKDATEGHLALCLKWSKVPK